MRFCIVLPVIAAALVGAAGSKVQRDPPAPAKKALLANAYQHAEDAVAAADEVGKAPDDAAPSGTHGFRSMFKIGDDQGVPIGSMTAIEEGIQPVANVDLDADVDSTDDDASTPHPSAWLLRAKAEDCLHGHACAPANSGRKGAPQTGNEVEVPVPQHSIEQPSSTQVAKQHHRRHPEAPDTSLLDGADTDVNALKSSAQNSASNQDTQSDDAGDQIYAKVLHKFALAKKKASTTISPGPAAEQDEEDDDDAALQMPHSKHSQATAEGVDQEPTIGSTSDTVGLAEQIAMAALHSAKATGLPVKQTSAAHKQQILDEDGLGGAPIGGYRNLFSGHSPVTVSGRSPELERTTVGFTQSEEQVDALEKTDKAVEERALADAKDQTGSEAAAAGLAHHFLHLFSDDANTSSTSHVTGKSNTSAPVAAPVSEREGEDAGTEDEQDGLRNLRIISGQDPETGGAAKDAPPVAAIDVGEDDTDDSDGDTGEKKPPQPKYDAPGHFKALFGSIR